MLNLFRLYIRVFTHIYRPCANSIWRNESWSSRTKCWEQLKLHTSNPGQWNLKHIWSSYPFKSSLNLFLVLILPTKIHKILIDSRHFDGPLQCSKFHHQDMFVRDNITEDDILVVDVGGNDVALHPTCGVIFNIILLLYLTPTCLSFFCKNAHHVGWT